VYDLSEKRRIPAYTDRVLFRPPPPDWPTAKPVPLRGVGAPPSAAEAAACAAAPIRLVRYDAVASMRSSDHKPVVAEFDVRVEGLKGADEAVRDGQPKPLHGTARAGRSSLCRTRDDHFYEPAVQRGHSGGSTVQSAACAVM
jgi:hypothetical protein